jgi:hypothetical protein
LDASNPNLMDEKSGRQPHPVFTPANSCQANSRPRATPFWPPDL